MNNKKIHLKLPKKQSATKEVGNALSSEEIVKVIRSAKLSDGHSEVILEELGRLITEARDKNKSNDAVLEKIDKLLESATSIFALENHYLAAKAVGKNYRPFILTFAQDLIQEYGCEKPSERAASQAVALAYTRVLELSKKAHDALCVDTVADEVIAYYNLISKELDRAHRQFTSALLLLKQLKSPSIELSIRAKNAFIAQNQQINSGTRSEDSIPKKL